MSDTFVIASRRYRPRVPAGMSSAGAFRSALSTLDARADVLAAGPDGAEQTRHTATFQADPATVHDVKAEFGEAFIVEPQVLHHPSAWPERLRSSWNPFADRASAGEVGAGERLEVVVRGDGGPLRGCDLLLYLRLGRSSRKVTATTGATGTAAFEFAPGWQPAVLYVVPPGGYWDAVVRGPRGTVTVDLTPLPPGPLGWWHRRVGITEADAQAGASIRVGVVDTGVLPHAHLAHVTDAGAFIGNDHDPDGGGDVDSHGSHVCGTIGARPPTGHGGYAGVAPGAELVSARVFADAETGADQNDIANAVDALALDHSVDLLNLSLGATTKSAVIEDALLYAADHGVVAVAAAGNSAGPLEYPGALTATVAVGALGLEGWGPPESLTATRYPDRTEHYGNDGLYVANFSCSGANLDCCAPGVGVISTIPERHGQAAPFGGMDGTSMAAPVACGVLARLLAADAAFGSLPRDDARAARARSLLVAHCASLGLPASHEGRGLLRL